MKLLLLEDQPELRRATEKMLRSDGVTIIAFESPAQCDVYLSQHDWDDIQWIVSDNRMPGEWGTAWFLRRRAEIERHQVRFVLITGDSGFQWQHTPWLAKPFQLEELLRVVYG